MSTPEARPYKYGPITQDWDLVNDYIQTHSCKFSLTAIKDLGFTKTGDAVCVTTEDDVLLTGWGQFPVTKTDVILEGETIGEDLFTLAPEQMKDLGIGTLKELETLRDFIDEAKKNCKHAFEDMKKGDFHLYKQSREDLFRAGLLKKEFPDAAIVMNINPIT
jgi:hypothetical protein